MQSDGPARPYGARGRIGAPAQTYPLPGAGQTAGAGWIIGGESWLARGRQVALQWARAEAGPGRLFPWIPVAFGIGIALYFTAEREPSLYAVMPAAFILSALAWLARRHVRLFPALALIAALSCGFAAATLKAAYVAHPVLTRTLYKAALSGYVETREVRERSDRFVLRVVTLEAARNIEKIERVRLTVRKGQGPQVGAFVSLNARLSPPLPPSRPGGYDFARDMYFQGIGASGFVLGKINVTQAPSAGGWKLKASAFLQNIRDGVDGRISAFVQGDARAIASALLTGRRDAISAPVNDAMFVSGLGHVLSISGYHMAVVAGVVFFVVRLMLALVYALVPALAGSAHAKRVAALVAFVAAAFYLALSGAEVATIRSFVMTGIVLAGIMVDRRAITFRTLALAALFVLATTPEALVHPSFQMSFAATLAIVALIDRGMPGWFAKADDKQSVRLATWGAREVIALLLVSLVAGLATTPSAAYHFHRVTPYGALANLLAMPVISFLVMPAGMLGLVAIPFGFDGMFWRLMEGGILWMTHVAQGVANMPGALGPMPEFSSGLLLLASLGIVVLCLMRGPLRLIGAGLIALSCVMAYTGTLPEIRIAPDGRSVAVRGADGQIRVMEDGRNVFAVREWLAADADRRLVRDASLVKDVACDGESCHAQLQGYGTIALVRSQRAMEEDCARVQLIVSRHTPPRDCRAAVIGPQDWRRYGAMNLYRERGSARGDASRADSFADDVSKGDVSRGGAPKGGTVQTYASQVDVSQIYVLRMQAARPAGVERPWIARAEDAQSRSSQLHSLQPGSPQPGSSQPGASQRQPLQAPSPAGSSSASSSSDDVLRTHRVSSIQNGYVHLPASRAGKRESDAHSPSTIFNPYDAEEERLAPEAGRSGSQSDGQRPDAQRDMQSDASDPAMPDSAD